MDRLSVAVTLLMFGTALAAIGAGTAAHMNRWIDGARRVEGIVVDHERERKYDNTLIVRAVIAFPAEDGREAYIVSHGASMAPYTLGERVGVLHPPGKPEAAKLNAFISLWLLPLMFGTPGALMLAAGIGLLATGRKKKTRR